MRKICENLTVIIISLLFFGNDGRLLNLSIEKIEKVTYNAHGSRIHLKPTGNVDVIEPYWFVAREVFDAKRIEYAKRGAPQLIMQVIPDTHSVQFIYRELPDQ